MSTWWALFAAGLVVTGFWRGLKPVRMAGLLVSALAVAKVIVRDLSELSALYRVASVLTLGLASLVVAYLYHRYTARHTGVTWAPLCFRAGGTAATWSTPR